jgi:hypothetical protein
MLLTWNISRVTRVNITIKIEHLWVVLARWIVWGKSIIEQSAPRQNRKRHRAVKCLREDA